MMMLEQANSRSANNDLRGKASSKPSNRKNAGSRSPKSHTRKSPTRAAGHKQEQHDLQRVRELSDRHEKQWEIVITKEPDATRRTSGNLMGAVGNIRLKSNRPLGQQGNSPPVSPLSGSKSATNLRRTASSYSRQDKAAAPMPRTTSFQHSSLASSLSPNEAPKTTLGERVCSLGDGLSRFRPASTLRSQHHSTSVLRQASNASRNGCKKNADWVGTDHNLSFLQSSVDKPDNMLVGSVAAAQSAMSLSNSATCSAMPAKIGQHQVASVFASPSGAMMAGAANDMMSNHNNSKSMSSFVPHNRRKGMMGMAPVSETRPMAGGNATWDMANLNTTKPTGAMASLFTASSSPISKFSGNAAKNSSRFQNLSTTMSKAEATKSRFQQLLASPSLKKVNPEKMVFGGSNVSIDATDSTASASFARDETEDDEASLYSNSSTLASGISTEIQNGPTTQDMVIQKMMQQQQQRLPAITTPSTLSRSRSMSHAPLSRSTSVSHSKLNNDLWYSYHGTVPSKPGRASRAQSTGTVSRSASSDNSSSDNMSLQPQTFSRSQNHTIISRSTSHGHMAVVRGADRARMKNMGLGDFADQIKLKSNPQTNRILLSDKRPGLSRWDSNNLPRKSSDTCLLYPRRAQLVAAE